MSARPHPSASRWSLWLPVGLAAAFYSAFIARTAFTVDGRTYFSLFDDGMISLTYARTLAEGHGLVWQPGAPPVEGYTNFAWTLWMALLHLVPIGIEKVSLLVMLSGAVLLVVNLFLVHAIARRVFAELPAAAVLAVWLTALYYPLAYWTLRGMEVGLLATLISAAVVLALRLAGAASTPGRDLASFAAVMVVGVLTRTDAVVPLGVVALYAVATTAGAQRLKVGLAGMGALGVALAGHTAFRLAYYGEALPNTYYLKLAGTQLGERVVRGGVALTYVGALHLWAAIAVAAALFVIRRRLHPAAYLLAGVFVAQSAYSVYVGGDAWEWMGYANRYVATAAPALMLLCAAGAAAVAQAPVRRRRVAGAMVAALGLGAAVLQLRQSLLPLDLLQATAVPVAWAVGGTVAVVVVALALGRTRPPSTATLAVAVAVVVAVNAQPLAQWVRDAGVSVDDDARMARYAVALRDATEPDAQIAVVWAGAIPYFSQRPSVDLLGKSDPVVARLKPLPTETRPGHTKWDYAYSIGRLRPDVVAQVYSPRRGTLKQINAWGYTEVAHRTFVRNGSDAVDAEGLRRALAGNPHASGLASAGTAGTAGTQGP